MTFEKKLATVVLAIIFIWLGFGSYESKIDTVQAYHSTWWVEEHSDTTWDAINNGWDHDSWTNVCSAKNYVYTENGVMNVYEVETGKPVLSTNGFYMVKIAKNRPTRESKRSTFDGFDKRESSYVKVYFEDGSHTSVSNNKHNIHVEYQHKNKSITVRTWWWINYGTNLD